MRVWNALRWKSFIVASQMVSLEFCTNNIYQKMICRNESFLFCVCINAFVNTFNGDINMHVCGVACACLYNVHTSYSKDLNRTAHFQIKYLGYTKFIKSNFKNGMICGENGINGCLLKPKHSENNPVMSIIVYILANIWCALVKQCHSGGTKGGMGAFALPIRGSAPTFTQ